MAFRCRSAFLAVALVFCTPLVLQAQSSGHLPAVQLEPHDFKGAGMSCLNCHTSVSIRERSRLIKPVSQICGDCHSLIGQSHPVDIVPSFPLPAGFPLDDQKRMTCSTCHDVHRSYRDPAAGAKTMYLRRNEQKKDFCLLCHNI